ncbi:MAG: DUF362 domain-containing protein [Gemmataceae bacterium]|nr:DUF362 domain-containing protein [Gemmataceae bacterium]
MGIAGGATLGWWGHGQVSQGPPFQAKTVERVRAPLGMPGPFPGRVAEARNPRAVRGDYSLDPAAVRVLMERGITELVGAYGDVPEAWRRFFSRGDVVGIKVNPVGRRARPNEPGRVPNAVGSISSPEVVAETIRSLVEYCGIPRRDILIFDRYANEMRETGFDRLASDLGVDWCAASAAYDDTQVEIDGQVRGGLRDPKVVGYDPDVFVTMGFAAPEHDSRDDRRHRSHLTTVVTRRISKLITIPCLKDHKSSGVTLSLKNMSHGMNNNVCRSHLAGIYRIGGQVSGPNQCNTFIPTAVRQGPIMEKATLHILDGLVGVYEGGPGNWNRTWGVWPYGGIFFATDPVAMDHIGWNIIDAERARRGWAPVAQMGMIQRGESVMLSAERTAMAVSNPMAAASLVAEHLRTRPAISEPFDRRQPEHIALAGMVGLGHFPATSIERRVVRS